MSLFHKGIIFLQLLGFILLLVSDSSVWGAMGSFTIGDVEGSFPNWRLANLRDHGVRRTIKPKEVLTQDCRAVTVWVSSQFEKLDAI